jgi:hypothetical protein
MSCNRCGERQTKCFCTEEDLASHSQTVIEDLSDRVLDLETRLGHLEAEYNKLNQKLEGIEGR